MFPDNIMELINKIDIDPASINDSNVWKVTYTLRDLMRLVNPRYRSMNAPKVSVDEQKIQEIIIQKAKAILPSLFAVYRKAYYPLKRWYIIEFLFITISMMKDDQSGVTALLENCFQHISEELYDHAGDEIAWNGGEDYLEDIQDDYSKIFDIVKAPLSSKLIEHDFYSKYYLQNDKKGILKFNYRTNKYFQGQIVKLTKASVEKFDFMKDLRDINAYICGKLEKYKDNSAETLHCKRVLEKLHHNFLRKINELMPTMIAKHHGTSYEELLNLFADILKKNGGNADFFDKTLHQLSGLWLQVNAQKNSRILTEILDNGYITQESINFRLNFLEAINQYNPKAFISLISRYRPSSGSYAITLEEAQLILEVFAIKFKKKTTVADDSIGHYNVMMDKFFKLIVDADLDVIKKNDQLIKAVLNLENAKKKISILSQLISSSKKEECKKYFIDLTISEVPELSALTESEKNLLRELSFSADNDDFAKEKKDLAKHLIIYAGVGNKPYKETVYEMNAIGNISLGIKTVDKKAMLQTAIDLANEINDKNIDFLILAISEHAFYSTHTILKENKASPNNKFRLRIGGYFEYRPCLLDLDQLEKMAKYFLSYYKSAILYDISQFNFQCKVDPEAISYHYLFESKSAMPIKQNGNIQQVKILRFLHENWQKFFNNLQQAKTMEELIKAINQLPLKPGVGKEYISKIKAMLESRISEMNQIRSSASSVWRVIADKCTESPAINIIFDVDKENDNSKKRGALSGPSLLAEAKREMVQESKFAFVAPSQEVSIPANNAPIDYDAIKIKEGREEFVVLWKSLEKKLAYLANLRETTKDELLDTYFPSDYSSDASTRSIMDPLQFIFEDLACPVILNPVLGPEGANIVFDCKSLFAYFNNLPKDTKKLYPGTQTEFKGENELRPLPDSQRVLMLGVFNQKIKTIEADIKSKEAEIEAEIAANESKIAQLTAEIEEIDNKEVKQEKVEMLGKSPFALFQSDDTENYARLTGMHALTDKFEEEERENKERKKKENKEVAALM